MSDSMTRTEMVLGRRRPARTWSNGSASASRSVSLEKPEKSIDTAGYSKAASTCGSKLDRTLSLRAHEAAAALPRNDQVFRPQYFESPLYGLAGDAVVGGEIRL